MNDRDREGRENPHVEPDQAEARRSVFESARESEFDKPKPQEVEPDPDGYYAPGGDSRPDETDPEGAQFERIDDEPLNRTTRTPEELPKLERGAAEEMAQRRSDDNQKTVARPTGPLNEEGAELDQQEGDERGASSEATR
jgi:hypothetical protein